MTATEFDVPNELSMSRGGGEQGPPGIRLNYRHSETIVPGADLGFRQVERWHVSIFPAEAQELEETDGIGYANLNILNLTSGVSIADLADRSTGDWVDLITKPSSAERQTDTPQEASDGIGNNVLVLDRLWIDPAWRGRGLGPIAAAAAVLRLSRGCRFVACYPAPFDRMQDPARRNRSIEALGAIWATVGFRSWNDGVWMLDLAETDLHAVLQSLLNPRQTSAVSLK